MSRSVRSAGAGLLLGASFMINGIWPVKYFHAQLQRKLSVAFDLASKTISKASAESLSVNQIQPYAWAAICIGSGLLIAGIIIPLIEKVLFYPFRHSGSLGGCRSIQLKSLKAPIIGQTTSGPVNSSAIGT